VAVDKAIRTALQKLPADRFPSAAAFSAALADSESDSVAPAQQTGRTLVSGEYRLTEDVCRRLARESFDPRLIGSSMQYLDNGAAAACSFAFSRRVDALPISTPASSKRHRIGPSR
jgi:hypothetical protein